MTDIKTIRDKIAAIPYVRFGEFVMPDQYNKVIDAIKDCIDYTVKSFDCNELYDYVKKFRTVRLDDTILPEDHNNVVEALKAIRDCLKRNERDTSKLDAVLNNLRTVKYEDYVLADDHNYKIDALKEVLAILELLLILTVIVKDKETLMPIEGANVTASFDTKVKTGVTDANGITKIYGIDKNVYVDVEVTKTGYFGDKKSVFMDVNKTLEFELLKAPTDEVWFYKVEDSFESEPPDYKFLEKETWDDPAALGTKWKFRQYDTTGGKAYVTTGGVDGGNCVCLEASYEPYPTLATGVWIYHTGLDSVHIKVIFWARGWVYPRPGKPAPYLSAFHSGYAGWCTNIRPIHLAYLGGIGAWSKFRVDFWYDERLDFRMVAGYKWNPDTEDWELISSYSCNYLIGYAGEASGTIFLGIHNPGGWECGVCLDEIEIYVYP